MSATYKVQTVAEQRTFNSRDGDKTFVSYKIDVTDGTSVQRVELVQVPTTPAPQVGDELHGNITQSQYGLRFRKERKPGENRSGGGGQKDGTVQAAITRQAAQRTSAIFLSALAQAGFNAFEGVLSLDAAVEHILDPLVEMLEKRVAASAPKPAPTAQQTPKDQTAPVPAPVQQHLDAQPEPEPETIGAEQAVDILNSIEGMPDQAVRVALIAAGVHNTAPIEQAIQSLTPSQATAFSSFIKGAEVKAA